MLTIINCKTGEVKHEELKHVAEGQVLIKNCSDDLINQLVAAITRTAPSFPLTKQEIKQAKQNIAIAKECGGNCCKANRPTEDQVERALKKTKKSLTCKEAESTKAVQKDVDAEPVNTRSKAELINENADLANELAALLVNNRKFVAEVWEQVNDDIDLNPYEAKLTETNILVVLALYAHFAITTAFTAGEGVTAYTPVVKAGRDMIRSIATRTCIIDQDNSNNPPQYQVSEYFEILFSEISVLCDGFDDLYAEVTRIKDQMTENAVLLERMQDEEAQA